MEDELMEQLIEILEELVPGEEFEGRSNLVTDGVLDCCLLYSIMSEIASITFPS